MTRRHHVDHLQWWLSAMLCLASAIMFDHREYYAAGWFLVCGGIGVFDACFKVEPKRREP